MSLLNGDRARAHKVSRKRRVRRTQLQLLRRVSAPAKDKGEEVVVKTAA